MRILLSLTVLSVTLALCQGACMFNQHEAQIKDGQLVQPTECTDLYDGSKHPFDSKWNTAKCLECRCSESGMECCHRYGGPVDIEGCKAEVDPETCQYKFYNLNDPSKPCPLA